MKNLNIEGEVCAGQILNNKTSAHYLVKNGIPASTATLHALGECQSRPRTEGGAVSAECSGCGLAISQKEFARLRSNYFRDMALRVNDQRSPLEVVA